MRLSPFEHRQLNTLRQPRLPRQRPGFLGLKRGVKRIAVMRHQQMLQAFTCGQSVAGSGHVSSHIGRGDSDAGLCVGDVVL